MNDSQEGLEVQPIDDFRGVRLNTFTTQGLDRGRGKATEILWYFAKVFFFLSPWPWPARLKRSILIAFGAKVGKGLVMRPHVDIHFPWKLEIGENCWVGDNCVFLNLEPIVLEDHVALAHQVYLAAASHDVRSKTMAYANKPIRIKMGTWVATRTFIGPGVVIGENCVIGAGSTVLRSVPDDSIVGCGLATVIGKRELINP